MRYLYLTFIVFCTISFQAYCQSHEYTGGIYNLSENQILEGSSLAGGLQPNYIIESKNSKLLSKFFNYCKSIEHLDIEQKIQRVIDYVQASLPDKRYNSAAYLDIIEHHRNKNIPISLERYLEARAGVCRENALLLHLGLQKAGVESRYAYIQAKVVNGSISKIEDHAFVLYSKNGKVMSLDSYNKLFHKREFSQLLSKKGINLDGIRISISKLNQYPNVYASATRNLIHSPGDRCLNVFKEASSFDNIITRAVLNSRLESLKKPALWSKIKGLLF